ncbi:hypothetical protein UA08_09058 [Talaromyces atroroseus]|uniref:Carboxypeptidase n=1 Tax=Talaromyces atroroseus TaxID=1441469 RepID=A0A1Q5Q7H8_TALAT|nr:hypothetical protein UA08_09058 [Talaromyces atroroseus]OKL55700.1 hypothetical protein UA08_09058 [Talaromyces atroroseus]
METCCISTNGTLDLVNGNIIPHFDVEGPLNKTGTFGSQTLLSTANTTANAARHLWNFAQVWPQEFDIYKDKSENDRVGLWTESYGGRYGPGFAAYFHQQNEKIVNSSDTFTQINFDTLGVINGCIDLRTQETADPDYAYNPNNFGVTAINRDQWTDAIEAFERPKGCIDQIDNCLQLAADLDPDMYGNVTLVNEVCYNTSTNCQAEVEAPYIFTSKVQQALGVPVNFTLLSNNVGKAFNLTSDYSRRDPLGSIGDIAYLLEHNVQVALLYGDRDFDCNWAGVERVSIRYESSVAFQAAGYANITHDSDIWGQVRQHGNFSFSCIYQSGHMIPSYQPEAALEVIRRAMNSKDVETDTLPPAPAPTCYLWALSGTCAENQKDAVGDNISKIENYVITYPEQPSGTCPNTPTSVASNDSELFGFHRPGVL